MNAEYRCYAVVPAAGTGSRFGSDLPKQYQLLQGKPVLRRTLEILHEIPWIETIVLVHAADDEFVNASFLQGLPRVLTTTGGNERATSVLNGLWALGEADENAWVMVHDAVRPCVDPADLAALAERCEQDACNAAILAVPVRETLKKVSAEGRIVATVDRSDLWQAATPQMCRLGLLRKALQQSVGNPAVTDEASALELLGIPVSVVQGRADNIKITWPQDLALADAILSARKEGAS